MAAMKHTAMVAAWLVTKNPSFTQPSIQAEQLAISNSCKVCQLKEYHWKKPLFGNDTFLKLNGRKALENMR
jgi:hypothetical protein